MRIATDAQSQKMLGTSFTKKAEQLSLEVCSENLKGRAVFQAVRSPGKARDRKVHIVLKEQEEFNVVRK